MNNNQSLFELINTKIIYNNIKSLKDTITKNYSSCLINFFEYFNELIIIPSSVNLSIK